MCTHVCVCTLRNENVLRCSFKFGGSRQIIILIEETTTTYKINYAHVGSFSLTKPNLSQNESGTWFNEMQNQNSAIPQLGKNTKQFTQTNTICIISNQSNKMFHFFLLYYFLNAVITNISKWELQWAVGVLSAVVGLAGGGGSSALLPEEMQLKQCHEAFLPKLFNQYLINLEI